MRSPSLVFLVAAFCVAWPLIVADNPWVIQLWPGQVPEESGNIGPERIRMSPKSERKQVEVTEPTRLITAVTNPTITVYRPEKAKDQDELAPGLRIPTNTPPVFLVHGSDDIVSPPEHSVVMYLALKKAGIPVELHLYANTTHVFGVRTNDHPYSTWTDSCARWLRHQGFLKTPP
jgi:acetyl esterase/lipase